MPPNKEQRERLKRYLELVDDIVDPAVDFVELGNNALAFWEAYFWGRVACHLHMRVGKQGQRGARNLCADFKVFRGMPEIEFDAFSGTFFKLQRASGYKCGGYHPVFISVGEDSEDGERIPLRLASSVGLQALDDCPMRGKLILLGYKADWRKEGRTIFECGGCGEKLSLSDVPKRGRLSDSLLALLVRASCTLVTTH